VAQGKYAKYFTEIKEPYLTMPGFVVSVMYDKHQYAKSIFHCETFIWSGPGYFIGSGRKWEETLPSGEVKKGRSLPHRHPADELFVFMGTDPNNPTDLGGEHEFWLGEGDEAERHLITKTTCLYVPKGVVHNPNGCLRLDRPYVMFVVLMASEHLDEHVELPQAFLDERGGVPSFSKG
jgi:hypothetical protein